MPTAFPEDLRRLAETLKESAEGGNNPVVEGPLAQLEEAANEVGKAWSGSSYGFHASVYYADLKPPPPGAHFSSEWGFRGEFQGTTGDWQEYQHEEIVSVIRELAGNPDLTEAEALAEAAKTTWSEAQAEVISTLAAYLTNRTDALLEQLKEEAEQSRVLTKRRAMRAQLPTGGPLMSRDTTALMQGLRPAPHQEILAEAASVRSPFSACSNLAQVARRAAAHIDRLEASSQSPEATARRHVFIGHGQSPLWRELKDFVSDRLGLPWDEFNRVPVAGITNIARLSEMLDNAGIALLVLTADDETRQGTTQARQNVVHEAGLFQGRLGFERAIVLLEDGCEEFSNIHGLGQIRFPAGRIQAAFEDVRQVLEREGFIAG